MSQNLSDNLINIKNKLDKATAKKKNGDPNNSDEDFIIPFDQYQLIEILNQKETDNLQQIII